MNLISYSLKLIANMKLLSILFLFISAFFFAQNPTESKVESSSPALLTGYSFSWDTKKDTETGKSGKIHTLELAYARVIDYNDRHAGSMTYYFGNNFSYSNKYDFFIAPKVGFTSINGGLLLGSELQFQTDFNHFVPRIMPYFGVGSSIFKFYGGYNFRLAKSEDLPVNNWSIGMSVSIMKMKSK